MTMRVWRGAALAMSTVLVILSASSAAYADSGEATLTLDPAFVGALGKTAAEQAADLSDCAAIPDEIDAGSAGWRFGQPATDASVLAYSIGYIGTVDGKPGAIVIGVTAEGIWRITTDGGQQEAVPVPEGVGGGLLDEGADGAWLRTPADWRLAPGALRVTGATGAVPKTFGLSAVCLPALPPPASGAPDDDEEPGGEQPDAEPSASPSTPVHVVTEVKPDSGGAAGGLPVTGSPVQTITLAGLSLAALGALTVLLARRRSRA
ncbi:LPXTG cell wall anchor domain-containing protein [Actinoplanes sp. NPDC049265]|uniref:LPXTG cell wall anchor domain-containing protein n=1 Tax=Actinoplanes sp. NPDC049265 TaxID=3363902 RepID=UPI00371BB5BF